MLFMKKLFFLILILTLVACGNKSDLKDEFISSFSDIKTFEVNSQQVKLEKSKLFLSFMFKIVYWNDLLFISEAPDPEYSMKIVNVFNGNVRNFAKKGRGPNEIAYQGCDFFINELDKEIYISDGFKYFSYSLDSLKIGLDLPKSKFSMSSIKDRFMENTYCNGFLVGGMHNQRFGVYHIKNRFLIKKYNFNNILLGGALNNQAFYFSHPRNNLVAYFYYKSAKMGILRIDNNKIENEEFNYWDNDNIEIVSEGKKKIKFSKDARNGFITAAVSNDFIYVLYSGKKLNRSSIKELTKAYLSRFVYVFDWQGKPVKKYKLDQEVRSIAIDEKNKILYAGSYSKDLPILLKFQLTNK